MRAPNTAVILAAGSPPSALGTVFGRTCSAMVPINGRPTIHWLLSYLLDLGVKRVVVGLRSTEARLPRFVDQTFGQVQDIEYVRLDKDLGPGYTLLQCLDELSDGESCLVVLGDTLFGFSVGTQHSFSESFVLTASVEDSPRWCLAKVDKAGRVTALADKPQSNPGGWPALIGVYHLRDCTPAKAGLQKALGEGVRSLQIRHALQPYIDAGELRAHVAGEWLDCGNIDLLTNSRRRLLQARSFNVMQIDDLRGTITKRSEHTSKFLSEINYYRLVPKDLATFFPRLVDYSLDPNDLFLTLEYYGYPTLSEIWAFEDLEAGYWEGVFKSLRRILSCFQRYTVELSSEATFTFYWRKTLERLEAFSRQNFEVQNLVEAPEIVLNGVRLSGWPKIRKPTEDMVRRISARPEGRIIHGDLCFPNILYDPLSRLFKFIDPRGSFADSGLYGDGRYDVAKLLHSIDGGYDFLIHDMFSLKGAGSKLELQQFFPDTRRAVLSAFTNIFCDRFDLKHVRALEGLLFLSMCPLHKEQPKRQTAMFATGIRILNEVLNDEDMH
jgi:dTDP-glucose pyrophosphorylase